MDIQRRSRFLLADYEIAGEQGYAPPFTKNNLLLPLMEQENVLLMYPQCHRREDGSVDVDVQKYFLEKIDEVDACLIANPPNALSDPRFLDKLCSRIEEGLRVWINLPNLINLRNPPNRFRQNLLKLLDLVGVELTTVGLFDDSPDVEHPAIINITRADAPGSFRHTGLFKDTSRLTFQGPFALRLHGPAQAVVAVRPSEFGIVDKATDYLEHWNEPDLAIASCSHIGEGVCFVTSGLVYKDAYRGPTGVAFPGGEHNQPVWSNLIQELRGGRRSARYFDDMDIHREIQSIERNLLELSQALFLDEWPEVVGNKIEKKARDRAKQEGGLIPWWAYLDLSDHINTLARNLGPLKPYLDKGGYPTSRKKFESEVLPTGKLMSLRILAAHPTKRLVADHTFSLEDLEFLQGINARVIRLLSMVRPPLVAN